MIDRTGLDRIVALTQLQYRADAARLARVSRAEADLRAALSDLDDRARRRFDRLAGDPGLLSGLDRTWREDLSQQRAATQQRLALTLAEKSDRKDRLRRTMGRRDMAQSLKDRHMADLRTEARRKGMDDFLALVVLRDAMTRRR